MIWPTDADRFSKPSALDQRVVTPADTWLASSMRSLPEKREALDAQAMRALALRGWQPDYLTVRRRADLQPPRAEDALTPQSMVVLGAARLGHTRLIDNFEI